MEAEPAPRTEPDTGRDMLVAVAGALLVAATVLIPAVWPAPPAPPTLATFQGDPTCAEWTDSCVVCTRTPSGPACSTPGIACQAAPPRCLRRQGS